MKRLFDKNDRWTDEAVALDTEINEAIEPIIQKWQKKGYSLREIFHVAMCAISTTEMEFVISKALEQWKNETKAKDSKKGAT